MKTGDIVRIRRDHPSVLAGEAAVVLEAEDERDVWLATNGTPAGADYPLRHVMKRADIVPYGE